MAAAHATRLPNLSQLTKEPRSVLCQPNFGTRHLVGLPAAFLLLTYVCLLQRPATSTLASLFFHPSSNVTEVVQKDELEIALGKASMEDRTVIIGVLNKAYVEKDGMLDLFLRSMREGEGTESLIKHLFLVAVDQRAFNSCQALGLHCYQLITEGVDFSKEALFMSGDFIKMMWRRTLFLGDVLKRGYNFVFTDMDVMWVRNPFTQLNPEAGDLQISCDKFNGRQWDIANGINTGFYYVVSNNRTIKLFDAWYAAKNEGLKDQDVLGMLRTMGIFNQLGMRVRVLDTLYFSGFCQYSRDFKRVCTVHANCCRSVKAKLADLTNILDFWKTYNGSANAKWPGHDACVDAWKDDVKV